MIRLCTVEISLYLDFFGEIKAVGTSDEDNHITFAAGTKKTKTKNLVVDSTYNDSEFQAYLTNLCAALHRTVRRGLLTVLDLDTLGHIVSVSREERSMAGASPTTMAAARAISGVILDAQERLVFCANTVLNRQVIKFKTSPAELDNPNKLRQRHQTSSTSQQQQQASDSVQQQLKYMNLGCLQGNLCCKF